MGRRERSHHDGNTWHRSISARVDLSDVTGTVQARLPEAVALPLSGQAGISEFLAAVTAGDPVLPTMLSVKIARRQRTDDSSQAQGDGADTPIYMNYRITQATAQPKENRRSQSALTHVPFLRTQLAGFGRHAAEVGDEHVHISVVIDVAEFRREALFDAGRTYHFPLLRA